MDSPHQTRTFTGFKLAFSLGIISDAATRALGPSSNSYGQQENGFKIILREDLMPESRKATKYTTDERHYERNQGKDYRCQAC